MNSNYGEGGGYINEGLTKYKLLGLHTNFLCDCVYFGPP